MNIWLRVTVFLATVIVLFMFCRDNRLDDYLITARYSRNLANGTLLYNQLDRLPPTVEGKVQGFTSPLHMLLGAAGEAVLRLGDNLPYLFIAMGAMSVAAIVLLTPRFAAPDNHPVTTGVAALTAMAILSSHTLVWHVIGMEAFLAVMLGMAAIAAYARGRLVLSAGLLALATLTRHDTILLAAILAILHVWQQRGLDRKAVWAILVFALPLLAWHIFAKVYFGAFLPNTFHAKAWIAHAYSDVLRGDLGRAMDTLPGQWPNIVLLPLAISGLVVAVLKRNIPLLTLNAWAALHFLAYFGIMRLPTFFAWYFAPATIAITVNAIYLMQLPVAALIRKHRTETVVALLMLSILTLGHILMERARHESIHLKNPGRLRHEAYQEATRFILEDSNEMPTTVACGEIGILGFYLSEYTILDQSNLVNRDVNLLDIYPEYIVYVQDGNVLSDVPQSAYTAVHEYVCSVGHRMFVYKYKRRAEREH